jgi:hypothetical protein
MVIFSTYKDFFLLPGLCGHKQFGALKKLVCKWFFWELILKYLFPYLQFEKYRPARLDRSESGNIG